MRRTAIALCSSLVVLLTPGPGWSQTTTVFDATLSEPGLLTQDISIRAMRDVVNDGTTVIIDSRSQAEFDAGHIPGARPLAGAGTAAVDKLVAGNKQTPLVLYCNGPFCQASRRLGDELAKAGFTSVRRYQLGMPVWRAFGGPTAIEIDGVKRVLTVDGTAVFIDVRPAPDFAKGSLPRAQNAPLDEVRSGKRKFPLPEDDFNRRVIVFGADAQSAREAVEMLKERPWHNVMYVNAGFADIEKLTPIQAK